jgi:dipeptidyl-peptidase-3
MKLAKQTTFIFIIIISALIFSCSKKESGMEEKRLYKLERVGPAQVVQLYADGFDKLSPKEKIFAYYLNLAAIAGRDIAIDQHHVNASEVRDIFEQIYLHQNGIDSTVMSRITEYLKLFWINNGFYDNIISKKFVPRISFDEFKSACEIAVKNGANFFTNEEPFEKKLGRLKDVIFNPGNDWIKESAVNFYDKNLRYPEIEKWARTGKEKYPLNSKVVKENGKIIEKVWRAGNDGIPPGIYASDLKAVIKYLEMAIPYASGEHQAETIRLLIRCLKTGDPEDFRKYNINWVKDSSIFFTNPEQTKLMQNLAKYAQYFEDKAPWLDQSPIANVINLVGSTGGTGPVSPIGINLPNEQAIREQYGSKSVLLITS